jgi:SAM-dependent methyltransferase
MSRISYPGAELDLFSVAVNWKSYWKCLIHPYLKGDVLEVGAGIGSNTLLLRDVRQRRWVCLEPDETLVARLTSRLQQIDPEARWEIRTGTIDDIDPRPQFEAIIYLDVLEHIADAKAELSAAERRLRTGGYLIVLAPAHQMLFSEFDTAVGHHRRYTKSTLAAEVPYTLTLVRMIYLDSVGFLMSFGNRWLLHQPQPTRAQIALWDRVIVPCSRFLDPILRYTVGKSVLGIWRKSVDTV